MHAAETCRSIVNHRVIQLVSAAMQLVQGFLLRGCAASTRTLMAMGRKLHPDSQIDDHDF
jgi:hypothetical protein